MNAKLVSFIRFACLVYLVFLIPKAVSVWGDQEGKRKRLHVLLGVEHLVGSPLNYKNLKKYRFALICDKESFDQEGNRTVDLLNKSGFYIKKIFVKGGRRDQSLRNIFPSEKGKDRQTGIPLYFLRGNENAFIKRNSDGIDAFVVDLTDKGLAPFGLNDFFKNLFSFAAVSEKRVVILDRPNPLGAIIEGPGAIPWRHGLTIGELSVFVNRYITKTSANVTVIPMKGWRRGNALQKRVPQKGILALFDPLNYLQPSFVGNKIHNREVVEVFFNENEKLSRWETRYLKRICWRLGLHCIDCSQGACEGVKLSLKKDISRFSGFNSLLTISRFLKNRKQLSFAVKDKFDEKLGTSEAREFLQGHFTFDDLKERVSKSLAEYYDKSKYCCLYKPLPRVIDPEIVKV